MVTRRLPHFLIVGAPKCGTTSLAATLGRHPNVFVPSVKEVGFFNREEHWQRGLAWYEQFFEPATAAQTCLGEATPYYMIHEAACQRIHQTMPDGKLIFLLRNPIDRAHSHYWYRRRAGKEGRTFTEAIRAGIEEHPATTGVQPGQAADYLISLGRYTEQIDRYRRLFPPEQLQVMLLDDLAARPDTALREVQAFLEIPVKELQLGRENTAQEPVSTTYQQLLNRLSKRDTPFKRVLKQFVGRRGRKRIYRRLYAFNQRVAPKPALPKSDRQMLADIYRGEIEALGAFLGRDLKHWLEPPAGRVEALSPGEA